MKKIFANTITIIIEILLLIIAIIWYGRTPTEESLIAVIAPAGFLIVSLFLSNSSETIEPTKTPRPRIVFHRMNDYYSRTPTGYTRNNPRVIRLGIDEIDQYWELEWTYILEIRNNSSVIAYNVEIDYLHKPERTRIEGEIGKIQPVVSHEKFEYKFKLFQSVSGTHLQADEYLKENPSILFRDMKIIANYKDEFENQYSTEYDWIDDSNTFTTIESIIPRKLTRFILPSFAIILLIGLISIVISFCYNLKNEKAKDIHNVNTKLLESEPVSDKKTVKKEKKVSNSLPIEKYKKSILSEIKDSVQKKDNTTINATNALIVTNNQSGGTNTVINSKVDIPEPKIKGEIICKNEKITTIPAIHNKRFKKLILPSPEYNFDFLYKSQIKLNYSADIVLSGFGFMVKRSDCVLSNIGFNGLILGKDFKYENFKVYGVEKPSNGIYIFTVYTTNEIDDIFKDIQLVKI